MLEGVDKPSKLDEIVEFYPEIDPTQSGLETFEKRLKETTQQYWQTGLTTPQKKLAMLKQGGK